MKRTARIFILCAILMTAPAGTVFCYGDEIPPPPTPKAVSLTVALPETEPEKAPPAHVPTPTPKATFVPLPKTTPDEKGNMPTPPPPYATPYPSPEGSPLVEPLTVITIATAAEETDVRYKEGATGSLMGTIKPGESFRVLGQDGTVYKILYNGQTGYAPASAMTAEEKELAPASSFTAGSLNIHGCRAPKRAQAIADLLKAEGPDIVGLQEVYRANGKGKDGTDWLARIASLAGYPYYAFKRTCAFSEYNYGIAIISRYPIVACYDTPLDGYEGDEARGIQYCAVMTDKGLVHVANTHLSASEMYKKSYNIASMVYTLRALGVSPYIVTGDFNCSPPRIFEYMPDIYFANMTTDTWGDGSVPKILDNVLYTDGLLAAGTEVIRTETTDHGLVKAVFYHTAG